MVTRMNATLSAECHRFTHEDLLLRLLPSGEQKAESPRENVSKLWGVTLLSDAKTGEDPSQQVIGREFTGDLAERLLGTAQFLREQFSGTVIIQLPLSESDMVAGAPQRIQVAAAGNKAAFAGGHEPHDFLQVRTKRIKTGTRLRGYRNDNCIAVPGGPRGSAAQIDLVAHGCVRNALGYLGMPHGALALAIVHHQQDAIRLRHRHLRPPDTFLLDRISARTQPGGIKDMNRHAVEITRLAD